ncbi:MAG: DUF5916 domain-containing protein [Vicinamibacterales bacterium]
MRSSAGAVTLAAAALVGASAASAAAQAVPSPAAAPSRATTAAAIAMASRGTDGQLVVRAQRLRERLSIDGSLNESVYSAFEPVSDFVQAEPRYGEPATEQTQLWVFFDERAVYVGIRCLDSDPQQWSSIDMRRDTPGTSQGETVTVALDTFNDKRNGYSFGVNPNGGISDAAITNERDYNRDWNTIWETRTARFDGGWTVEMSIPFKSLRYSPGEQIWGINVRRAVRWKNEISYLNPVPQGGQFSALFGLFRFSSAASLVGVAAPPESRLFEVKPYAISSLKTDLEADAPFSNKAAASLGLDTKVGITRGLTADLTYNTDFAQVEEDEQQANLTRFSLFFPEKREFFLEGQGIFTFGGASQRRTGNPGEVPIPFFSRRIGIDDNGQPVPILGGGRLTGRVGPYSIGLVNIQTRQDDVSGQPSTNFAVLRLRRDILRRSNIGVIAVNRSAKGTRLQGNQTYGVDGLFSFFENLNINTYVARTQTPQRRGNDGSYRVQLEYNADRYGVILEDMMVGEDFNPETGYVRRKDIHRNVANLRFSPRPRASNTVRKYEFSGGVDQFARVSDGLLETRVIDGSFGIEFDNSDRLGVQLLDNLEQLTESFNVFGGVKIPGGRYQFRNLIADYTLGQQHPVSGMVSYEYGGFFAGTKHTLGFTRGRAEPMANLFVEPGVSLNWVDLPQGRFVAKVLTSRVIYTFTPRTFIGALVQYNSNSNTLSVNARLRWEYRQGSDLFVVYSDGRDTFERGLPKLQTRSFTVKLTRFFRL